MSNPSPFDSLKMPPPLACEFFAVFSRFEFALKEPGHVYVNRYGRAAPDWESFAALATLHAPAGLELARAVAFLNDEPPQIQTSAHGWTAAPLRGNPPVAAALDAAQRARNNLFHGGKHTPQ